MVPLVSFAPDLQDALEKWFYEQARWHRWVERRKQQRVKCLDSAEPIT
jgi:hypothetical protein